MASTHYMIILLHVCWVNGQQDLRSSVSDRFFHRQRDSLKPAESNSPDLWSSGVRSSSTFFQKVCRCSRISKNRQLVNARPFEIAYMQSEQDCVVRCATTNSDMKVACASLNYCSYDRRCELFQYSIDQAPFSGTARCLPVNGCSYYVINAACIGLTTLRPISTVATLPTPGATLSMTTTTLVTAPTFATDTTTTSLFETTTTLIGGGGGSPSNDTVSDSSAEGSPSADAAESGEPFPGRKSCPGGQNAVYTRTPGFADARVNIPNSQAQNVGSAADCQSECDKRPDCQAVDYIGNTRTCNIYNSVNKDALQAEPNAEHYDSYCVPANCQGTIDRVPNKVQFSAPTTETAASASECINKCLANKPCLSVSYFTTLSKDNCLLSQQSRQTDPISFLDEKSPVDYYGLDSCASPRFAAAKKKLVRNQEQVMAQKKPAKPSPIVKADLPLPQRSSPATSMPNAKAYRQMVIAAQKQKTSGKKT